MANVIQCDRCKAIAVTEEARQSYVRIRTYLGGVSYEDIDLCTTCKDAFNEFLNGEQKHDVNEI